nr:MAG TPA: hypothetical protein [Caudoviricetes sp.]
MNGYEIAYYTESINYISLLIGRFISYRLYEVLPITILFI